jgi:hypothetical protein
MDDLAPLEAGTVPSKRGRRKGENVLSTYIQQLEELP